MMNCKLDYQHLANPFKWLEFWRESTDENKKDCDESIEEEKKGSRKNRENCFVSNGWVDQEIAS